MQQGRLLRVSTSALAALLAVLALSAGSAAGSTGGVSAPSTGSGGTYTGSTGGTTTGSTTGTTGATTPATNTGGISPNAVRTPTAPVKPRKKKRKKRRRRAGHHAPAPTPAPTPTPTPAPAPAPPATSTGDIPSSYLALYKAAAKAKGIDWRILAAIGKNESDHGRSTAPGVHEGLNFANCCAGPMQMCTVKACGKVWQFYAVDADGDGVASVYDPADAIYAAAALVKDLQAIVGTDPKLVLAAYNAGPGNVAKYDGVPPFPETRAYVRAGLAYIDSLG